MMGYGDGMMGGVLLLGLGVTLLVLAAVAAAIVAIFMARRPSGFTTQSRPDPEPTDILRRRFASGEIDDEEYRRRLDVLKAR